jgi:hypothetical protein
MNSIEKKEVKKKTFFINNLFYDNNIIVEKGEVKRDAWF